jgi:hypothetical protein
VSQAVTPGRPVILVRMPTKREIFAKIQGLLAEKTGGSKPCVVCGQNRWIIVDKYVRFAVTRDPNLYFTDEKSGFPFQPLVCSTCGNTHFINLLTLGFSDADLASCVYPSDEDETKKT